MPQTTLQWGILVFLGVVASGIGYFMWNYGATQVDAGTLGIMNNMHVPAGLLVNGYLAPTAALANVYYRRAGDRPHCGCIVSGSLRALHKRQMIAGVIAR